MSASPYTLDGARRILTGNDQKTVELVNMLLGVAILGSGVGYAATGITNLLAAWGWIDQKNEFVGLLSRLTAQGRQKLYGASGHERHEVLAATHAALVNGAFFTAIQESLGPLYEKFGMTDKEKQHIATRAEQRVRKSDDELRRLTLLEAQQTKLHKNVINQVLYDGVPLPWAGCGFSENMRLHVQPYYESLALRCIEFFSAFEFWRRDAGVRRTDPLVRDIVGRSLRRYEAEYKSMASEIKEFEIWAVLGEHQATHQGVDKANRALRRVEELLGGLIARADPHRESVRRTIAKINQAILDERLIPETDTRAITGVSIPTVRSGYIDPDFRWAVMDKDSRPANERWWEGRPRSNDLDTFLAAYFSSSQSLQRPLVILGHPGSGKSLFSKVCAARLSASTAFTAATVPLREVPDASLPIYQQIESVLAKGTHGRVRWSELCTAAEGATRVLLIDGLDELMQATGSAQSHYLHSVVEFQRIENLASAPVAVVVTCRTIVADIAKIPIGSLVIRLEDFSDNQVAGWLEAWELANQRAIEADEIRIIGPVQALQYGTMSRQPLLLLLLTLYAATKDLPPPAEDESSPAELYDALLREFIWREMGKTSNDEVDGGLEVSEQDELWRLGVAAFAMLNRGSHYINESLLIEDLKALDESLEYRQQAAVSRRLGSARRVLGKFFFVQTSEADGGEEGRSYEFLHATFREYLIAYFVLEELKGLWMARDRPASQRWDDDRMYALISHQLLNAAGAAVPSFLRQLWHKLDQSTQSGLMDTLRVLLQRSELRWSPGRFKAYDPSNLSYVQRFSVYTGNLVQIIVTMTGSTVPLEMIAPRDKDAGVWWNSLVHLWRSGFQLIPGMAGFTANVIMDYRPELAIGLWRPMDAGNAATDFEVNSKLLALEPNRAAAASAGLLALDGDQVVDGHNKWIEIAGRLAARLMDVTYEAGDLDFAEELDELCTRGNRDDGSEDLQPRLSHVEGLVISYVARFPNDFSYAQVFHIVSSIYGRPYRLGARRRDWKASVVIGQYPDLLYDLPLLRKSYLDRARRRVPAQDNLVLPLIVAGEMWPQAKAGQLHGLLAELRGMNPLADVPMESGSYPPLSDSAIRDRIYYLVEHEYLERDRRSRARRNHRE
ncbi:hypothetical protein AB0F73_18365 [Micromonospora purpureochromogenes]|uniref:NACHT domain-containing protein n=1 Tax=Micromonospora purpureochromogenes TaxID=47872 RepID=UPI0034041BE6